MSANTETIPLGWVIHEGITYDVFADLIDAPPVGDVRELDPTTMREINDIAIGVFKAHAKAWGNSLKGKTVVFNSEGGILDGKLQKHSDLPPPSDDLHVQHMWDEGIKKEILAHVAETATARFIGYKQLLLRDANPDDAMQKMIEHMRKEAKKRDADILEAIRKEYIKTNKLEESFKNIINI